MAMMGSTTDGGLLVAYARVSTEGQDLSAQRTALLALGVEERNIYTDQGLTGRNRDRPGLGKALAAVRTDDTLAVTKLDRLARSLRDATAIADELTEKGVRLNIGGSIYDPADPVGRMLFAVLGMVAEFESDLIRARTREGMQSAKVRKKLTGRKPKLSTVQQRHLVALHQAGGHTVAELCTLFSIGRATLYRVLDRHQGETALTMTFPRSDP